MVRRVPTYRLEPGDRVRLVELGGAWHPARTVRRSVVGVVVSVTATPGRVGRRSARVCVVRVRLADGGAVSVVCTEAETHWRVGVDSDL